MRRRRLPREPDRARGLGDSLNVGVFAGGLIWAKRQVRRVAAERATAYRELFRREPLPSPGDKVQALVEDEEGLVAEIEAVYWPHLRHALFIGDRLFVVLPPQTDLDFYFGKVACVQGTVQVQDIDGFRRLAIHVDSPQQISIIGGEGPYIPPRPQCGPGEMAQNGGCVRRWSASPLGSKPALASHSPSSS